MEHERIVDKELYDNGISYEPSEEVVNAERRQDELRFRVSLTDNTMEQATLIDEYNELADLTGKAW